MNSTSNGFKLPKHVKVFDSCKSNSISYLSEVNDVPMTERRNEVKTTMHPVVGNIASIEAAFIAQKSFELIVNVLYNSSKAEKKTPFSKILNKKKSDRSIITDFIDLLFNEFKYTSDRGQNWFAIRKRLIPRPSQSATILFFKQFPVHMRRLRLNFIQTVLSTSKRNRQMTVGRNPISRLIAVSCLNLA